jgi:hypothetical protein
MIIFIVFNLVQCLTNYCIWSWALLERPSVVRTLDSFPAFYGTRRFNTEYTRPLRLFLSWARPIQSTSPHPNSKKSILILSIHLRLGLPSGLFHYGFPTNNLYAFLFCSNSATCPAHHIQHKKIRQRKPINEFMRLEFVCVHRKLLDIDVSSCRVRRKVLW